MSSPSLLLLFFSFTSPSDKKHVAESCHPYFLSVFHFNSQSWARGAERRKEKGDLLLSAGQYDPEVVLEPKKGALPAAALHDGMSSSSPAKTGIPHVSSS